ncbi:MAG TPA: antitoxin [Marmoricola sp.]|nr:antitoxin [Marmoricola sp.]
MSFNETLKQKIDEWDLDRRANELAIQAERGVNLAMDKASELASQHQGEIASWLDRAGEMVDEKTQGKYAEQVAKVREGLSTSLGKLADRHQAGPR